MNETIDELIPDMPSGPLTPYRQMASFDWKQLKVLIEGQEYIRLKTKIWKILEKDPLFARTPEEELPRKELRRLTFLRMKRLHEYEFLSEEDFMSDPMIAPVMQYIIGSYDWGLASKRFLSYEYFIATMRGSGSKQHFKLIKDIKDFRFLGAFSMTELSHGSNVRAIKTTAKYDPITEEFVLNTPSLEAIKCWSGDLGQTATHAIVFAQLFTPDGHCHGLHSFLVPIRDPNTLLPFPGITVGDMGPKLGQNGLDNGFMKFENYRIGRNMLMNKSADVTTDGKYVTKVKEKSRRVGATLGILSAGRVGIINIGIINLHQAITIAIRYSAVRRQFGPSDANTEWSLLEYSSQQWRLFPYLSSAFIFTQFFQSFYKNYINFYISVTYGGSDNQMSEMGAEIHALSCSAKAFVGWIVRDAIQECRECCGGHGYLQASGFGHLREDHDANNTYEGDNTVILQQTSNWLLKLFEEKRQNQQKISSPFGSTDFIDDFERILSQKIEFSCDISSVIESYHYLICYILKEVNEKLDFTIKLNREETFRVKSESQVFQLRTLSLLYIECFIITTFNKYISDLMLNKTSTQIVNVLKQIESLFAFWCLEKHIPSLCQTLFFDQIYSNRFNVMNIIRTKILENCSSLRTEAVALIDVISPPDFILNSSLGMSDGNIYENIFKSIKNSENSCQRPEWWTEFTDKKPISGSLKPKL